MDCDRLDVTFEDIAGMEAMKRSLQEIISEPLDLPTDLYPVSGWSAGHALQFLLEEKSASLLSLSFSPQSFTGITARHTSVTTTSSRTQRYMPPSHSQARLIKPCTGILIYGPPGCGKTLIAKAVAKQSGAAFLSVKASTLMRTSAAAAAAAGGSDRRSNDSPGGGGGGVGHSSVMVRAVFSLAHKVQPCIVFLDEADGLCYKREEGDRAVNRRENSSERTRARDDFFLELSSFPWGWGMVEQGREDKEELQLWARAVCQSPWTPHRRPLIIMDVGLVLAVDLVRGLRPLYSNTGRHRTRAVPCGNRPTYCTLLKETVDKYQRLCDVVRFPGETKPPLFRNVVVISPL